MNEKVWKIGCLWILLSCTSITNVSHAACTPTPDCASMGYTETSCDGDSLKCPFDISKLYCIPCDSSFKYNCVGDNIIGGVGLSCGGKYVSCECVTDYEWNGEMCEINCPSEYKYACTGEGETDGRGETCGGLYTACYCDFDRYCDISYWDGEKCVCEYDHTS